MRNIRQILTVFLSAYLLILIVLPCTDAHNTYNKKQSEEITQGTSEHKDDFEVCTPFCVCGSCITAMVVQPIAEYTLYFPDYYNTKVFNFYQSVQSDFHGSIWQPPQLA
jgi:hypothetical protein